MKHVALLRGINVGGNTAVPMAQLKGICEDLGWENVSTLLRSGNVVFASSLPDTKLEEQLQGALDEAFGISFPVVVRSRKRFSAVLSENPFEEETAEDPSRVILYLSKRAPAPSAHESLAAKASAGESVVQQRGGVWIHYPNGLARSKVTPAVIDRAFGSAATGRNWKTLVKLCDALDA